MVTVAGIWQGNYTSPRDRKYGLWPVAYDFLPLGCLVGFFVKPSWEVPRVCIGTAIQTLGIENTRCGRGEGVIITGGLLIGLGHCWGSWGLYRRRLYQPHGFHLGAGPGGVIIEGGLSNLSCGLCWLMFLI